MPTILELFQNNQVLSNQVKSDKRTLVDTELKGIRIKSGVDVNNPRVYGFEALRITDRSTEMLDIMKSDRGTEGGVLGKLTGTVDKIKGKISGIKYDILGFPKPGNPSNVLTIGRTPKQQIFSPKPGDLGSAVVGAATGALLGQKPYQGNEQDTNINIANLADKAEGTEIGKLLKESLKTNTKNIGKEIVGGGIKLLKDKARDFLFGSGDLKTNDIKFSDKTDYGSGQATYSETLKKLNAGFTGDYEKDLENQKVKLEKVSPIHGVNRMTVIPTGGFMPLMIPGQFGMNKDGHGYRYLGPDLRKNETLPKYTAEQGEDGKNSNSYTTDDNRKKVKDSRKKEGTSAGQTLDERGLGYKEKNRVGLQSPQSDTQMDENSNFLSKKGERLGKDLVPFHITRIGFKKNIFKSYITGLSETVSPSWSSNNFIGNPYKYYIYESIERSVTFTLNIVAESAEELARNWEKLSHLTKAAYPLIPYQEGDEKISSNIVSPPFIKFTLGDMYRERFGVLDALSYTVPDASPWETDIDGFVLPKFIDASITIKFAEDVVSGNVDKLYDFKKGGENGFLTNPIN